LALPELTDAEHAKGLNRLGWVCYRRGDYEGARRIFEKAEPLWAKTGDTLGRAAALNFLAMTCQALKYFEAAMERYRSALTFLPEGEEWRAMIHMNLGLCAQEAQKYADAIDAYEAALKESEKVQDARIRTAVLNNLSNLYVYLGRLDRAGGLGHASLKFAIENGLTGLEGQNYLFLAHVADKEGNLEDFRKYVEKAKSVLETAGSVSERARARLYEAYLALTAGEEKTCRSVLKGLRADFPAETELMAQCDLVEGKLALKKDPPDAAHGAPALERAKAYYQSRSDEANLWEVLNVLGQIHRVDRPMEARDSLTKALAMLDRLSEKIPEAYRASFFRDRKREKILENLNRLNVIETKRGDHGENRPH
jgi:tetratricopeptide (TPR) repeat protein